MIYEEPVAVFTALGLVPVLFVHPDADVGDAPRSLTVHTDERIPPGGDYVVGVRPGEEDHVRLDDVAFLNTSTRPEEPSAGREP